MARHGSLVAAQVARLNAPETMIHGFGDQGLAPIDRGRIAPDPSKAAHSDALSPARGSGRRQRQSAHGLCPKNRTRVASHGCGVRHPTSAFTMPGTVHDGLTRLIRWMKEVYDAVGDEKVPMLFPGGWMHERREYFRCDLAAVSVGLMKPRVLSLFGKSPERSRFIWHP